MKKKSFRMVIVYKRNPKVSLKWRIFICEIKKEVVQNRLPFVGSIISVVGKITIEIMELFECRQKVP